VRAPTTKHKGEIDIESFSWGVSNSGSATHGGGGGAGKASFQDFTFTAPTSKASPTLALMCAAGTHIPEGTLTGLRSGEQPVEFMKIKLTDILISSFQQAGSATSDALPVDQFSFNFAKIEYQYRSQNRDGSTAVSGAMGWDLKKNVKL